MLCCNFLLGVELLYFLLFLHYSGVLGHFSGKATNNKCYKNVSFCGGKLMFKIMLVIFISHKGIWFFLFFCFCWTSCCRVKVLCLERVIFSMWICNCQWYHWEMLATVSTLTCSSEYDEHLRKTERKTVLDRSLLQAHTLLLLCLQVI